MSDKDATHSDSPPPHFHSHNDIEMDPKIRKLGAEIVYTDEQQTDSANRQHTPLAQKLKSRHTQMIAIGMRSAGPLGPLLPIIVGLYVFWKLWSRHWPIFVRAKDMDVTTGVRRGSIEMAMELMQHGSKNGMKNALRASF